MNLSEYISDPSRRAGLARAVPIVPGYLWQIATGWRGRRPSAVMARKIEAATNGVVTRYELRPDVFGVEVDTKVA